MMKTTGVQKSGYVHGGGRGEADTADRRAPKIFDTYNLSFSPN